MIRWKDGKMEVVDGVEEVNILCDLFKVPEEVREVMVREEEQKQAEKASKSLL